MLYRPTAVGGRAELQVRVRVPYCLRFHADTIDDRCDSFYFLEIWDRFVAIWRSGIGSLQSGGLESIRFLGTRAR